MIMLTKRKFYKYVYCPKVMNVKPIHKCNSCEFYKGLESDFILCEKENQFKRKSNRAKE